MVTFLQNKISALQSAMKVNWNMLVDEQHISAPDFSLGLLW